MKPKSIKELKQTIAKLEFQNDQLLAELNYLNRLLRSIGFPEGLNSVKKTAEELLSQDKN
ncbi:hypothetical protein [Criblamydia sequanensis]|uniref:Uncharacterized protein n=1 Tax=Candidatus Criblamydia sequanensis CRIB-18 TaxID=1437425 RepID=A0A090CY01_9BACT|nr:hypothetical protein [Criblamydia sequanensis]CDR33021.1 conserved hypothetical protein [Criblamydia sequanensis CRIB-18]